MDAHTTTPHPQLTKIMLSSKTIQCLNTMDLRKLGLPTKLAQQLQEGQQTAFQMLQQKSSANLSRRTWHDATPSLKLKQCGDANQQLLKDNESLMDRVIKAIQNPNLQMNKRYQLSALQQAGVAAQIMNLIVNPAIYINPSSQLWLNCHQQQLLQAQARSNGSIVSAENDEHNETIKHQNLIRDIQQDMDNIVAELAADAHTVEPVAQPQDHHDTDITKQQEEATLLMCEEIANQQWQVEQMSEQEGNQKEHTPPAKEETIEWTRHYLHSKGKETPQNVLQRLHAKEEDHKSYQARPEPPKKITDKTEE